MSLHLKYRPNSFDGVLGNEDSVAALQALLKKPDRPHSYLFTGPKGCGKTTLGRIAALEVGSKGRDFHEIDSADFRGIDMVREVRRQSMMMPIESKCHVWLLDECHKLSNDAQNALLKSLEEAKKNVYYVLCTTDPQKLLATVRDRCSSFKVAPLADKDMMALLRRVVKEEGAQLQKKIYDQIVQDSQGGPRAALQILEQVLAVPEEQQLKVAQRTAETESQVIDLSRALMQKSGWKKVRTILAQLENEDPENVRRGVLGYCRSVLLKGENNMAAAIMEEFLEPFYNTGSAGLVFACYSVVCGE